MHSEAAAASTAANGLGRGKKFAGRGRTGLGKEERVSPTIIAAVVIVAVSGKKGAFIHTFLLTGAREKTTQEIT